VIEPLKPLDFPVRAVGQYVYRKTESSPFIGPVSVELAADLAFRLNRDEAAKSPAGLFASDLALIAGSKK
jgi:hypothetical protein